MHTYCTFNKWLDNRRKVNNCENIIVNGIALYVAYRGY